MSIVDILNRSSIFAAFFLLTALPAAAEDWQRLVEDDLCQRWQDIGGDDADCRVSFPGLSPNFQLQNCAQPPQINLLRPLQPGRNGLELACEQPWWRQNLAIQIHIFKPVVVLARAVASNQTLTNDDITIISQDIGTLSRNFFTSAETLPGMQIRRNLRAGTILTNDMLSMPMLVNRGDQVTIRVIKPGIRIEMRGTALDAGRENDRIRVRNDQSQRVVTGRVIETGLVETE